MTVMRHALLAIHTKTMHVSLAFLAITLRTATVLRHAVKTQQLLEPTAKAQEGAQASVRLVLLAQIGALLAPLQAKHLWLIQQMESARMMMSGLALSASTLMRLQCLANCAQLPVLTVS